MNPNTGSFGSAIGGADVIKQAMARRQMGGGGSPMDQQSPAAPNFNPTFLPSTPTAGNVNPMNAPVPTGDPAQAQAGVPQPAMSPQDFNHQTIVKALTEELKKYHDINKHKLGVGQV